MGSFLSSPLTVDDEHFVSFDVTHTPLEGALILADRLREMLVGHDPLLKEHLWERAWEIDRIEELRAELEAAGIGARLEAGDVERELVARGEPAGDGRAEAREQFVH